MLTYQEKRALENQMLLEIAGHQGKGIDTRTLINNMVVSLGGTITALTAHHVAGMLSWLYRSGAVSFLSRSPGASVVV